MFRNPDDLTKNITKSSFSLSVPAKPARTYNTNLAYVSRSINNLHPSSEKPYTFENIMLLLMLLRILCIYMASHGFIFTTIILCSLQFVIAPYSFFASIGTILSLAPNIIISHYVTNVITSFLISHLIPAPPVELAFIPISSTLIIVFFLIDQLYCIKYQVSHNQQFSFETLPHIVWGFLNTKTYLVLLLLFLKSANYYIDLIPWIIDAIFGITPRIATLLSRYGMCYAELEYHVHRMNHIPRVYEHAHKFHHRVHLNEAGTTPFDAHTYFGNGMPEEFFLLLVETFMAVIWGINPASLNMWVIQRSLVNKDVHTKKEGNNLEGEKFHWEHHAKHIKNFGTNCLLDMYFGTNVDNERYNIVPANFSNTKGEAYVYAVVKEEKEEEVIFHFNYCPAVM